MPDAIIDRIHDIAKNQPEGLSFGDRNNTLVSDIPLLNPIGPYESDYDSAYIPRDDDDTASSGWIR